MEYRDQQFTKAPEVLRGMRLSHLDKSGKRKKNWRPKDGDDACACAALRLLQATRGIAPKARQWPFTP